MAHIPLHLAFCVQHNYLEIYPCCFISSSFLLLLSLERLYDLFAHLLMNIWIVLGFEAFKGGIIGRCFPFAYSPSV